MCGVAVLLLFFWLAMKFGEVYDNTYFVYKKMQETAEAVAKNLAGNQKTIHKEILEMKAEIDLLKKSIDK